MLKKTFLALLLSQTAIAFALPFSSQHALVFEEDSGKILLEKNPHDIVPIASLTKVMTAMVVLDAKLDMNEVIAIEDADVDTFKWSSSRVPVGARLTRHELLELSLMSSDNRAAAALARTFPNGKQGFVAAVKGKLVELGMKNTVIEEPTGLSPYNRSNATDLVKMVTAAASYPEIARLSTGSANLININGNPVEYRNTNRLIGREDWDIRLSKTGFTREAGKCLIMRMQAAGKNVIVVLLNAKESTARLLDAENVQRYLTGQPLFAAKPAPMRIALKKVKPRKGSSLATKSRTKGQRKSRTV